MGMGLGSSAALCASVYDQCCFHSDLDLTSKQHDLGLIESLYHGKSSGFDALVCLIQKPLLRTTEEVMAVTIPKAPLHYYLVDSSIQRNTLDLVQAFRKKRKSPRFRKAMEEMAALASTIIRQIIDGKPKLPLIKALSFQQFEHLDVFIPPVIQQLWKSTLDDESLNLKLCGAGGGGYFLLISAQQITAETWRGYDIVEIAQPGMGAASSPN